MAASSITVEFDVALAGWMVFRFAWMKRKPSVI